MNIDKDSNKIWILFLSISGVLILWFGSYWFIELKFSNYEQKGQIGDMFGAINSLFSGLAFAGLIYAIYLQNKEIKLQKEELNKTREIAEAQEKALRSQAESQNLSVFQSSFTQMLEIHFRLMDTYADEKHTGSQRFNQKLIRACTEDPQDFEKYILQNMDARMLRHLFHISNIIELILIEFPGDPKKQRIYISRLVGCLAYYLLYFIVKAKDLDYYKEIKANLELIIPSLGDLDKF
ncbi:hypothetical protein [Leptospira bandrabouensis]|uniref:Uncharacterized protein n=1 Tax=Leptospira bandrabouensis TaxID=2484903 RepID=A0A6H3NU42_9LEPT|nr:hypothetical protein [Leptospira bandrabouensis]TGN13481.1 hypothetical protein EHR08_11535 [Leptospira bandrabouensis]